MRKTAKELKVGDKLMALGKVVNVEPYSHSPKQFISVSTEGPAVHTFHKDNQVEVEEEKGEAKSAPEVTTSWRLLSNKGWFTDHHTYEAAEEEGKRHLKGNAHWSSEKLTISRVESTKVATLSTVKPEIIITRH